MNARLQREKVKRDPEKNIDEKNHCDDRQKQRNMDRMKVHVLNKCVFQSMANLTFFLEYIAKNPELQEAFEDDLKELFDMKGNSRKSNNVFGRLIEATLTWNEKTDPKNFRLGLLHILQNIIFKRINELALTEFGDIMANTIVQSDMGRAWAWTKLYSQRFEKDNEEPDRPVRF